MSRSYYTTTYELKIINSVFKIILHCWHDLHDMKQILDWYLSDLHYDAVHRIYITSRASKQKSSLTYSIKSLCLSGYIIYYSTDVNAEVHDWVVEPVVGNRLTHQIQGLTLDTTYYFKIQARNSKGMGPMSDAVQFRTPKGKASTSFRLAY